MRSLVLAVVLACGSSAASAHGPSLGANGGRQVDAGAYHLEMVAEGQALTVFVRDHGDRPVETTGFRGTAILTVDGRAQRIPLAPAGGNRMTGTAAVPLPSQPKGVVQMVNAGGGSMQGRFD